MRLREPGTSKRRGRGRERERERERERKRAIGKVKREKVGCRETGMKRGK
jgi:hypothetical protein